MLNEKIIENQSGQNNLLIEDLNISFDSKILYQNFSLEIEAGKITALLAPSGAGKTTLLKHISNTEKLSSFLFQNPRLLPCFPIYFP